MRDVGVETSSRVWTETGSLIEVFGGTVDRETSPRVGRVCRSVGSMAGSTHYPTGVLWVEPRLKGRGGGVVGKRTTDLKDSSVFLTEITTETRHPSV